jgi:hypothetical protein
MYNKVLYMYNMTVYKHIWTLDIMYSVLTYHNHLLYITHANGKIDIYKFEVNLIRVISLFY